jgi:hypothetical protein
MSTSIPPAEGALNNPVLLLRKLRNLIFGANRPAFLIRLGCYVNLLIWLVFTAWHGISYAVISAREMLLINKQVDVEQLIFERGQALGFEPELFLEYLMQFHVLAMIAWAIVLVGIVMCWRQKRYFIYIVLGGAALYYALLFWNMGLRYFNEDTTWFDKVSYGILILNSLLLYIGMRIQTEKIPGKFWLEEEV